MTNTVEKYTYGQLLDEVEVLAGVLREEGVRKGDVVIIYSKYSLFSLTTCKSNMDIISTMSMVTY